MNTTYRVVIGGLQEGFSIDQVNRNLANLFKTTIDKLPDISGESNFIIKKNLDIETAKKYQSAIEKQGCKCSIEAESDIQLALDEFAEISPSKTVTDTANSKTTKFCYGCGFELPISAKFCRGCGSVQPKVVNNGNQSNKVVNQPVVEVSKQQPIQTHTSHTESRQSITEEVLKLSSANDNGLPHGEVIVEKSPKSKIIIASVVVIAIVGIYFGIQVKGKSPEKPESSIPAVVESPQTATPATVSQTVAPEQTDTVAGKFTIKFNEFREHKIILGDKQIDKCGDDSEYSDCDGTLFSMEKTFNVADKTVVVTTAYNGTSCPVIYQFYTISKDGSYQKLDNIGNCLGASYRGSLTQSGSKIILSLPTIEKNMTGTEVWTYEDGKITGPVKTIKPTFNVDPNKIQKIKATGDGAEVHNNVTGTIINYDDKENKISYYLFKFDKPVMIEDAYEYSKNNGDIVDELQISLGYSKNGPIVPQLGKGEFDISLSCGRALCLIDRIGAPTPTNTTESAIPKAFQGTWAEDAGCIQYKANGEFDPGAVITSDHINRYEHNCTLAKVTASTTNSFSGEFTCAQEGETMNENISLMLQPDGKLSGISNNPLPICK